MNLKPVLLVLGLWASISSALGQVKVENAWVRATVPTQRATGAFMTIISTRPVQLVSASSPASPTVEIHEMKLEGGVMKMRYVNAIDVSTDRTTELKPGGFHVMLLDLSRPIKEGDEVPIALVFEEKDKKPFTVEITARARALGFIPSSAPAAK